jgi:hypothetical protein
MANLTAAREDLRKDDDLIAFQVKAATTIFKGAIVGVDATGYAKPAAPADKRIVGIAYEGSNNTIGANGATLVRVSRKGSVVLNATGITQANIGDKVYVTDDNTVTTTATGSIQVGVIDEVLSATTVRVALTANI